MIQKSLKTIFFLIIPFLVLPSTIYALGFGDIIVYSKLNEPLKVHIELVDSKSTHPDDVRVKNASLSTYRRANLPKPDAFKNVRFKSIKNADGSIVVELTSKRPIREPFVTFIADMKWRNGHINREYTFLLDPPEFVQKQSRSKSPPKKSLKQLSTRKNIKSNRTQSKKYALKKVTTSNYRKSPKIDHSAVIAAHVDGDSYLTKRADTLWSIAKRVKPGKQVTTYQTVQALFALNPDAFIKGDINLLKQGQTLAIPTTNEIRQINGKPPIAISNNIKTIAQKANSEKKALGQQKAVELKSSNRIVESPSDNVTTANQSRLKIIPPEEELLDKPIATKKDLLRVNKALKTSISTIKVLQSENETLSDKIKRLTEKLSSLDSHNQELNNKIAEISSLLESKQSNKSSDLDNSKESLQSSKQKESTRGGENASQVPVNTKKPPQKKIEALTIDSQIAPTEGKPRSFIQKLLTSPAITFVLGIMTVLILIALLVAIHKQNNKRKQRKQPAFLEAYSKPVDVKPPVSHTNTDMSEIKQQQNKMPVNSKSVSKQKTKTKKTKTNEAMNFFEYFEENIKTQEDSPPSEPDNNRVTGEVRDTRKSDSNAKITSKEDSADISLDLDINDKDIQEYENSITKSYHEPVTESAGKASATNLFSEIDTYIAYGNYDKAERILQFQIQKNPTDKNFHLKLLECYTFANKRNEFLKHVKRIKNLVKVDMLLRHRAENIYQKTWDETLNIDNLI